MQHRGFAQQVRFRLFSYPICNGVVFMAAYLHILIEVQFGRTAAVDTDRLMSSHKSQTPMAAGRTGQMVGAAEEPEITGHDVRDSVSS